MMILIYSLTLTQEQEKAHDEELPGQSIQSQLLMCERRLVVHLLLSFSHHRDEKTCRHPVADLQRIPRVFYLI